jgi:hypothetical protein
MIRTGPASNLLDSTIIPMYVPITKGNKGRKLPTQAKVKQNSTDESKSNMILLELAAEE